MYSCVILPKFISVPTEQFLGEDILQTETKNNRINVVSYTRVPLQCCHYQSMMLVESAAEKPSVLKLSSVAVHRARPTMTGKRDRLTHKPVGGGGTKNLVIRHEKAIIWFKPGFPRFSQTSLITSITKAPMLMVS